ncbi:hypothetical protein RJ640_007148, partial [Escallonia rubra]
CYSFQNSLTMDTGNHIVAMPYPGRGHINPMVQFCTLLASKGVTITLVLTEGWLGSLIGTLRNTPRIRLSTIPNVVPSENDRTSDYAAFFEAVYTKMEAPFDRFLDRLALPISCILADTLLPWMTLVGRRRNIPIASLWTMAPSLFSIFYHFDLLASHGHFPAENLPEKEEEIIDYIPGVSPMQAADLPPVTIGKASILKYLLEPFSVITKAQAILFTSFFDLQPHVINTFKAMLPIPIYTIGPSIPYNMPSETLPLDPNPTDDTACLHWLDKYSKASVLYVSLGSFLSMSKELIRELSEGLQASGVRFLWVARGEASSLQAACGEMGLIVPWCDQLRILSHPSVGGFLTQCGWNSAMESIYAGVPMLTFPLFADQGHNSKLVVEDWKVGLRLKRRVGVENVVGREEISQTIKRVMDLNGEEGRELRSRAKELQGTCGRAIQAGGSTDDSISQFVTDFLQGQSNGAM